MTGKNAKNDDQKAEDKQLNAKENSSLRMKVSEKGAVSLYGLGRFPVTLYKEQWLRIFAKMTEINAFIQANDTKLKTK